MWGSEEGLRALLGNGIGELSIERRHFVFRARSAEDWLALFREFFGPVKRTFEALDPSGQEAYAADLLDLIRRANRADDGTVAAASEYLEVVAVRR